MKINHTFGAASFRAVQIVIDIENEEDVKALRDVLRGIGSAAACAADSGSDCRQESNYRSRAVLRDAIYRAIGSPDRS